MERLSIKTDKSVGITPPGFEPKDLLHIKPNNTMEQPSQEKKKVNTNSLSDVHLYLSGVKDGKGDLLPLGTIVLEDLMNAILYLRGDVRYTADRDE